MSRFRYIIASIGLYGGFLLFFTFMVMLVASVTIVPMYRNYVDHGDVFLRDAPEKPRISNTSNSLKSGEQAA